MVKRLFIALCAAAAVIGMSAGCSKERRTSPADVGGYSVPVLVSVTAAGDTEEGTDEGTDNERTIERLRVYAFHSATGKRAGYLYVEETGGASVFEMNLENVTPDDELNNTVTLDFYLIANDHAITWGHLTGEPDWEGLSPESLKILQFTELQIRNKDISKSVNLLPMSAVYKDFPVKINPNPGSGGIFPSTVLKAEMVRVIGKLGLYFAKSADNNATLSIDKITVGAFCRKDGNFVFDGNDDKTIAFQGNDNNEEWPVLEKSVSVGNRLSSEDDIKNEASYYSMFANTPYYMFENSYGSSGTNYDPDLPDNVYGTDGKHYRAGNVTITYSVNGEEMVKTVYLPQIERNHYYKVFCVIPANGAIDVTYEVADWDHDQEDDIEYDLDYATYTVDPLLKEETNDAIKYSTKVYYVSGDDYEKKKAGAFGVEFRFTSGTTCTPTLKAGESHFEMKVYKGESEYSGELVPDKDNSYYIYLYPTTSDNRSDEGVLILSAKTAAGTYETLLLNRDKKWNSDKPVETEIRIQQVDEPENI